MRSLNEFSLDSWALHFRTQNPAVPGKGRAGENWLWFVGKIASPIAEAVRQENFDDAIRLSGEALKWLCCFVEKYRKGGQGEKVRITMRLSDIVWSKYAGMCYACAFKYSDIDARSREYLPCVCPAMKARVEMRKKLFNEREKRLNVLRLRQASRWKPRPKTLVQWSDMIRTIYGPAHLDMSLSSIFLHFIEEVGEVARAIRAIERVNILNSRDVRRKMRELEEELADVFSWLFGVVNKLDHYLGKARAYYARTGTSLKHLPLLNIVDIARASLTSGGFA